MDNLIDYSDKVEKDDYCHYFDAVLKKDFGYFLARDSFPEIIFDNLTGKVYASFYEDIDNVVEIGKLYLVVKAKRTFYNSYGDEVVQNLKNSPLQKESKKYVNNGYSLECACGKKPS